MYQVIARKYRPQTFGDLISQEHVKGTLENAISQSRIAHGYIFSGQRGTGKTTVARIMARCLNCEKGPTPQPCGECSSCREIPAGSAMDVIEIDAASNRGINEMRELRENVRFRPARDRFKVFIVDEAHQITTEAFNALLKTLEEPPEWVVFILCTTESHKIPVTIASRCQQFSFRSVDFGELVTRMEWIAQQEGIQADADVLGVLAQAGEGSVRDSLSALDQAIACCGTKLEAAEVRTLLGMFGQETLEHVAQALTTGDSAKMLDVVAEIEANGRSLQHFARELSRYFRNLLVLKIAGVPTKLVAASPKEQERLAAVAAQFREEDLTRHLKLTLDTFKDLQASLQPRLHLEMGLLRLIYAARLQPIEEALAGLGKGSAPAPATQPTARQASPEPRASSYESRPAYEARPSSEPRPSYEPRPQGSGPSPQAAAAPAPAATPAPFAPERASTPVGTDLRSRLIAKFTDAKQTHLADVVENCAISESASEVVFSGDKIYSMFVKDALFEAAVRQMSGKRPVFKAGEGAAPTGAGNAPAGGPKVDEATTARALSHPEVQRFQELFPDSQVRQVRSLRESDQ